MRGALLSIVAVYNDRADIFDELTLPTTEDLNSVAELIDNPEELDKDTLVENILFELGELSLVYSEPDTLKAMIKIWSAINKRPWTQLWETLLYKYNPIWNKDGTYVEERELTTSGTDSGTLTDATTSGTTRSGSASKTTVTDQDTTEQQTTAGTRNVETVTDQDTSKSGTTSESLTANETVDEDTTTSSTATTSGQMSGTNSETIAHNVTGFDTNSYSPNTQDVKNGNTSGTSSNTTTGSGSGTTDRETDTTRTTSGTSSETGTNDVTETVDEDTTGTLNGSGTNDITVTETGQDSDTISGTGSLTRSTSGQKAGTEAETITRTEQGNIAMTTTQQMIKEQREIVQFNMYHYITESFKERFCVMVY